MEAFGVSIEVALVVVSEENIVKVDSVTFLTTKR